MTVLTLSLCRNMLWKNIIQEKRIRPSKQKCQKNYFEYVEKKDLQKEDIVIGYGNPGHIGIILDPKTKRNISTHHNDGIRIDENYNVYERVLKNENVEGGYELKNPRFLRYTGCKKK
ncbi:MAG: hypothetical protein CL760_11790 [Chloroflexi bacterium]|nr:hypothetical protein [Chloroflexota bacterium]